MTPMQQMLTERTHLLQQWNADDADATDAHGKNSPATTTEHG
jgi:hypothetical protein